MNYIWYPLIEALQSGYDISKIRFRVSDRQFSCRIGDEELKFSAGSHHISPLLEYLPYVMYDPDKTVENELKFSRVDINPYHRLGSIFGHILSPERDDPNDLIVCDILAHLIAHIDRVCGMSKRDFHVMTVSEEISGGRFGNMGGTFELFDTIEKRAVAEALIMLYKTQNSLRCLDSLFKGIMTDFNIYIRDKEEIVFYNPYGFDGREDQKLRFIIKLFLPVGFSYAVHWGRTYGVICHEESIRLEEFVL